MKERGREGRKGEKEGEESTENLLTRSSSSGKLKRSLRNFITLLKASAWLSKLDTIEHWMTAGVVENPRKGIGARWTNLYAQQEKQEMGRKVKLSCLTTILPAPHPQIYTSI